jgi:hypothetical protein
MVSSLGTQEGAKSFAKFQALTAPSAALLCGRATRGGEILVGLLRFRAVQVLLV